ncbi:MAG: IS630 family transposase [Paludibacteraceae bacterium]
MRSKKGVVALTLGVDKNIVSNTWKRYNSQGFSGLKDKKPGVSSESASLLNSKQETLIQKLITDAMPDQLKLDFALWTRKAVKELIEREFGIVLAINTVGDYLRKWGFTPQKPKKRAYEQCSKKVQQWLTETYPSIKQRAQDENADIEWGDETGVKNQCNHGRSYAPKGKTPVKHR